MAQQTIHARLVDDPCTTLKVAFDVASVRAARQELVGDLSERGFRQSFVDDAMLVASELIANSIEHGAPKEDELIDVSWCVEGDVVRISVHEGGPPATLRPLTFSDVALSGRGLVIVDHLCDSWHVDHENGLRVTAELRHRADVEQQSVDA